MAETKKPAAQQSGVRQRTAGPAVAQVSALDASRRPGAQGAEFEHDPHAMYRAAIEASADGFHLVDAEGRILEVNAAYARRSGYTREELLSMRVTDLEAIERPEETAAHIAKVLRQGSDIFETLHRSKDGTHWHVEVNVTFQPIDGGRFFCFLRDITGRKKVEERLRESEALFSAAFRSAPIAMAITRERDKTIVDVNQSWQSLTGYTREAALGHTSADLGLLIAPSDRDRIKEIVLKESGTQAEFRMLNREGNAIDLLFAGEAITLAGERYLLTMGVDITERIRMERKLLNSEMLYRNLVETTATVAWEVDIASLRFTYISPQVAALSGYPPEQWTDFEFWAGLIHPDDRDRAVGYCQEATAKGLDHAFEYRMTAADGRTVWIRDVVSVIADNGRPATLRGYFIDITASKLAEDRIRQNEEFIRNILDTVDEGFIVIDRDYRILTANKAYRTQVEKPSEDLTGKHCHEVSHRLARPCFEEGEDCAARRVFETGMPHRATHQHRDARGGIVYVETKGYPIKDSSGAVTSVIETIANITERHLLEEERLKTQKLESVGTLAGGIAHDFNNLLQGVFGYISMAKLTFDQRDKSLEMLLQAEKALHQSVNLTTQLLTFSKGGKPVKKRIAVGPVIENAVKFGLSGSRSEHLITDDPDLWQVEADEGQLGQVIQNIVLNADQAMPLGGMVAVSARNLPAADRTLPPSLARRDHIVISIQDNGVGIPEQYLAKIFDPYFTTKEKGSGLGLATSYSIVRNHEGTIEVQSKAGKGTTFLIYLPASAGVVQEAVPAAAPAGARAGRILVMDDEEMIRELAGEQLKSLGHSVEFAEKGETAITAYQGAREAGRPFDIVVLDLTIRGGMGGEETLKRLREIDPGVKAVVSSGYSDDASFTNCQRQGFKAFLKKPYSLAELQNVLNALLA